MTAWYFGDRAVLRDAEEPIGLAAALRLEFPAADVRTGLSTVLVTFPDPDQVPDDALTRVAAITALPAPALSPRRVDVDIWYDGADVPSIAAQLDVSPAALIAEHLATTWQVAMLGFAPGFPYLKPIGPGNPFASVPRLESPRQRVPAGSVGLAAGLCCIYPTALPGGWPLLGRTELVLFDAGAPEPSRLRSGDVVRFRVAG